MRRVIAALAVLGALAGAQFAFGGSEQATTWDVAVGEQGKPPAGTPKGATLNGFFPGRLEVNAGDRVRFTSFGFHTVSYLAGRRPPPPFSPAQGATYTGITDAAGQPFHFDGQPAFAFTESVFGPFGPKVIAGSTPASSGALFATSPKKPGRVTFTFPKTGGFKLVCQIHPGMEIDVVVKRKGARVQSAADVAGLVKAETDAAWKEARQLAGVRPPANTIVMGIDGRVREGGRLALLDFYPDLTTVKAGTPVRFTVRSPSEVHNVGLGPEKYIERFMRQTDLFPMGPGSKNQVTPVFIYGSDPRGTAYEPALHGNGFFATPLADGARGGLPNTVRVTFAKPGKYKFLCMIHGPDMAAAIRVTR
jgi:plastocyanin